MGKTTVELPDDLLLAAKKRALDERTTLRSLLERSLRRELGTPVGARATPAIEWIVADGGLPLGMDVANREEMVDFLRTDP